MKQRDGDQVESAPSSPSDIHHPLSAAKLRWRCRRGMRELDVLLERYLERHYAQAPDSEQRAFEALLELQDPQLFALVMRREQPVAPELAHVIARLTAPGS